MIAIRRGGRLFLQTGYFSPKVSLEPPPLLAWQEAVGAVPTYIDARVRQKLQSFPEISQNHAKTPIPGQKSRTNPPRRIGCITTFLFNPPPSGGLS